MKLSDPELHTIARDVGFDGKALHVAIACALAASGGIASYEHVEYPGPAAWYKGLWGVDLCEQPSGMHYDLSTPQGAARHAYDLTVDVAGFDWCPVFRTQAYAAHLARAATAATMWPAPRTYSEPITSEIGWKQREQWAARLCETRNSVLDMLSSRRR